MAEPDIIPPRSSLFNPPTPNYTPIQSGNPSLDLMFSLIVPQLVGPGKFLPHQFPAQNILDQFVSSKYRQTAYGVEERARTDTTQQDSDRNAIYNSALKIRSRMGSPPPTQVQAEQLGAGANFLASTPVQMIAEMLLGAQTSEDLFFGQRGSKSRLARGIGRMGFSTRDSVSSADRMSEDTLETFTNQIYSNLYGPGTSLSDVSGFSAGRVGDILNELSQRGLLPQSASMLNSYERRKVFQDKSLRDSSFTPEINAALDSGATVDELTKLTGGADAVRKIDATRVTNTLKDYTSALDAVREIFGDNNMGNAPMGQLMAAMEALTQNSMTSMSPGKIENLMRRMQLASRDSGVSLESLMGLTARSGALAEQYGLSRGIASENVIGAMERAQALKDTGGFTPGFGRMDMTKATMDALDQGMRADASTVGRLIGVANRFVAEGDDNFSQNQGKNLVKMVDALKRGDATYFDEASNSEVNIYQELGENPGAFFSRHFEQAGLSLSRANAYFRDSNTQEFAIANRALHAQAYELKANLAANFSGNSGLKDIIGNKVAAAEKADLQSRISKSVTTSIVDTVNTTMSAPERLDVLQSSMTQAVKAHVRETTAGLSEAEVDQRATDLMYGAGGMFKDSDAMRSFLAEQQGELGVFVEANYGRSMGSMQQMYNLRGLAETRTRQRRNLSRAALFGASPLGDNSNFFQRLSDSGFDLSNPLAAFGAITDESMRKHFYMSVGGGTDDAARDAGRESIENVYRNMGLEYQAAIETTDNVINKLSSGQLTFEQLQGRLVGDVTQSAFDGKEKLVTTAQLTTNIKNAYATPGATRDAIETALTTHYGSKQKADEEVAAGRAFEDLAKSAGVREYFKDNLDAAAAIGLDAKTATEAETRSNLDGIDVLKENANGADRRAKVQAYSRFAKQIKTGAVTASGIVDLFGDEIGAKNKDAAKAAIDKAIKDGSGDDELTKMLAGSGASAERQKLLLDATKMARAHAELGGIDYLADTSAIARFASLKEQVASGAISADSALGKTITAGPLEEKQKLASDPALIKTELDKEQADRVDKKGGKSTQEIMEDIDKSVREKTGAAASAAADPTGIGGAIAGAIGPAVGDAIENIFKGELKIANVTIEHATLDINEALADAMKALTSIMNVSAVATNAGETKDITGVLKVVGLETAVLHALPKDSTERTPGGASVRSM
jgi:hypothetical protein